MKGTLTALIVVLISTFLSAQPVIDAENFLPIPGETISRGSALQIIPVGEAGENMSWDYSGLSSFSTTDITFEIVEEQTGSDLFPNSSHVAVEETMTIFQYFSYNADSVTQDGNVADIFGQVFSSRFIDPVKLYEFPVVFGGSYTDRYVLQDLTSGNITNEAELDFAVDGYGTLVLPSGSYSDVLRLKRQGELKSFAFDEEGLVIDSIISSLTQIEFISEDFPIPLVSYGIQNQDTVLSYIAMSLTSAPLNQGPSYLSLFPNPAESDFITIESNDRINSISLFDLKGRRLTAQTIISGKHEVRVDCSRLSAGTYLVLIEDRNGIHSLKFVKQD